MIKKTITYTDYNGDSRTEDFYFNFSKAEIIEMELSVDGGMAETLQRISKANDQRELIKYFKKIVLDAYGQKSADGKQFIKNEKIKEEFAQTEAYSDLFMELVTNSDAAAEFVNGIIPVDALKKAEHLALSQ